MADARRDMGVILVVAGFHVFEGIPRQSVGAEYSATFSALIIFHVFHKHKSISISIKKVFLFIIGPQYKNPTKSTKLNIQTKLNHTLKINILKCTNI